MDHTRHPGPALFFSDSVNTFPKVAAHANDGAALSMLQSITIHISNQTTISKAYHLIGIKNYGSWAFPMKNILLRDSLYKFCIT